MTRKLQSSLRSLQMYAVNIQRRPSACWGWVFSCTRWNGHQDHFKFMVRVISEYALQAKTGTSMHTLKWSWRNFQWRIWIGAYILWKLRLKHLTRNQSINQSIRPLQMLPRAFGEVLLQTEAWEFRVHVTDNCKCICRVSRKDYPRTEAGIFDTHMIRNIGTRTSWCSKDWRWSAIRRYFQIEGIHTEDISFFVSSFCFLQMHLGLKFQKLRTWMREMGLLVLQARLAVASFRAVVFRNFTVSGWLSCYVAHHYRQQIRRIRFFGRLATKVKIRKARKFGCQAIKRHMYEESQKVSCSTSLFKSSCTAAEGEPFCLKSFGCSYAAVLND